MDRSPAAAHGLLAQRLVALALAAALLLTVPLLMPWLHGAPLLGWPRWAWALFAIWAALISLAAWSLETAEAQPDAAEPGPEAEPDPEPVPVPVPGPGATP